MDIIQLFVVKKIFVGLTLFGSFTPKATQTPDLFTPLLLEFIFNLGWNIEGHELASVLGTSVRTRPVPVTITFYYMRVAINICLLINDLRTYATKYFPCWFHLNTLHTVCFMHGPSIYEIKRICHCS